MRSRTRSNCVTTRGEEGTSDGKQSGAQLARSPGSSASQVLLAPPDSYLLYPVTMGKFSEAFGRSHDKKEETGPPPPSFSEATTAYHPPPSSAGPSTSFNANQPTAFACLLLASSDRIRTVNFPENTLAPMEEAIRRVWAPGVQAQGYKTPGNYEWKLSGRPCTL
jgi:hypothetical protein